MSHFPSRLLLTMTGCAAQANRTAAECTAEAIGGVDAVAVATQAPPTAAGASPVVIEPISTEQCRAVGFTEPAAQHACAHMAADPPFPLQVLTKQLAKLEQEVLEAQEADKANKAQLLLLMAALGKIVANQQRLASFEHLAEEAVKDFALYPSQNTPLSSPLAAVAVLIQGVLAGAIAVARVTIFRIMFLPCLSFSVCCGCVQNKTSIISSSSK